MTSANDNRKARERRVEIDCWLEGGAPYLVTVFDPTVQAEPIFSETFDELDEARGAARSLAVTHGMARIYDMTGEGA